MNSDINDLDELSYVMDDYDDGNYDCDEDCEYEYVDYEKQLKDVAEYLKEEHPAILADMILKDIIK